MFARINDALIRGMAEYKSREEGQAMAEYGLILALIAVVAIAALTTLGSSVSGKFGSVSAAL